MFDEKFRIGDLDSLKKRNYDSFEHSLITQNYVANLSLENINNKKCFDCIFVKYCQGLCPNVRQKILNGEEEDIHRNNKCKKIIEERLKQSIKWVIHNDKSE